MKNLINILLLSTLLACSMNNRGDLETGHDSLPNYRDTGYDTAEPLTVAENNNVRRSFVGKFNGFKI